jgi:hypothetical protein
MDKDILKYGALVLNFLCTVVIAMSVYIFSGLENSVKDMRLETNKSLKQNTQEISGLKQEIAVARTEQTLRLDSISKDINFLKSQDEKFESRIQNLERRSK